MNDAYDILNKPLIQIAGVGLTLGAILSAIIVFMLALVAAWGVRVLVHRAQGHLGEERAPALYIGGQVARYIIIFAGLALAFSTLGVNLSALSLFAGALGVGIGFGLQDVVKNFVCGIILLFDHSVDVGDFIELGDHARGIVTGIGPRATTLFTNDNVDVMVPNADLLNGQLTNWTRNRATRRIHVPFGVAYGSDKELVKKAVLEAAHSVPFTLPEQGRQRSQVWLTGFGDSALNFELVVWPSLEAVKRPGSMMAAYLWAIDDALREYGIEIPFPQRDIRLRGFFEHVGEGGLHAWRGENPADEGRPASTRGTAPPPGSNDAASDIEQEAAIEREIADKIKKGEDEG